MRTLVFGIFVMALLVAGTIGSWYAMNHVNPGSVGTPVHAGALSNGRPEDCTNINFSVPSRGETRRTVSLRKGTVLRATYEVHGGFGRVDVLMRIVSPQGAELYAPPKSATLDFSLPAQIDGDYVFVFDNRYSLFTAKSVALFYCIDTERPPRQGSDPSSPPPP
jgi:hypothetical protein